MKQWPSDFADLLSPAGNKLVKEQVHAAQFDLDNTLTPYINYRDLVDATKSFEALGILESQWQLMERHCTNIPLNPTTQCDPTLDYEFSPYSQQVYQISCQVDGATTQDQKDFFVDTGLLAMARSASLKEFAEKVTGYRLVQNDRDGIVVVCYGAGGYVAPHTDVKWPLDAGWEDVAKPIAWVDVHLAFSTDAVEHQYLIIQNGAYLNQMLGGTPANGALSIYRQPLWHYSTPLTAKKGRERDARRWIIMVNFELVDGNEPKVLR